MEIAVLPPSENCHKITSSCKLRVYPSKTQHHALGHQLYWVQRFRNEVVAFCDQRRKSRSIWIKQHPVLVASWKTMEPHELDGMDLFPPSMAGSDVNAASRWLTQRLEQARLDVKQLWNIHASKKELRAAVYQTWVNLTAQERKEIPYAWLLTLPRTVLDQCLQDLGNTYNKAIKDRVNKIKKPSGFPQFQKHSYMCSVRYQISTQKNKTYVTAWNDAVANCKKEIYIPSLGLISFRDAQHLPAVPPEMITVSRNAAGQFFVSFVNKDPGSRVNQRLASINDQDLPFEELYDPQSNTTLTVPVTRGGDVGLKTLCTYSQALAVQERAKQKKQAKRERFTKQYENRLRTISKHVSRKVQGSKRWQKAKIKQGKLHARITNSRHDYLKKEAQALVQSTAIICLEDLNLRFLLQNKKLSKSAADASLGAFKKYIQWEAAKRGRLVIECGRFDATSKTCSQCGHYHKDLQLSERTWTCPGCNTLLDRDENAAINIRHMALLKTIQGLNDGSIVFHHGHSKANGLSASGNGVPKMLSPHPLHSELTAFIKRGGLTSLLDLDWSRKSQADEALISSNTLLDLFHSGPT